MLNSEQWVDQVLQPHPPHQQNSGVPLCVPRAHAGLVLLKEPSALGPDPLVSVDCEVMA